MKVNVIQLQDATFRKWRWWSNWIDVAVFDYEYRPYLLQMRVSRANGKQFNAICMAGFIYRQASSSTIGDLTQMKTGA